MYNKPMKTPNAPGPAQDYLKGGLSLLILATLRDGPLHGYGLARTIEQRTENALQLREGTLYPALHGLERDGLISSAWETPEKGRERKVYTLTPSGAKKLTEWSAGWQQFVHAVGRVLTPAPQTSTGEPNNGTRSPKLRPAPGGSLS
jgi:PadR family transcriptional regulator PadR